MSGGAGTGPLVLVLREENRAPLLNTEELPPPADRVTPATHRDTCLVSASRDNTCLVCSTYNSPKLQVV